jgi:hypothetical protein
MAEGRTSTQAVPPGQRQRLAELAAELEAARISASPREKQFNWSRPATVSSAMVRVRLLQCWPILFLVLPPDRRTPFFLIQFSSAISVSPCRPRVPSSQSLHY